VVIPLARRVALVAPWALFACADDAPRVPDSPRRAASPPVTATGASSAKASGAASVPPVVQADRVEVCSRGEASKLELYPEERKLITRCGESCKTMAVGESGALGPASVCGKSVGPLANDHEEYEQGWPFSRGQWTNGRVLAPRFNGATVVFDVKVGDGAAGLPEMPKLDSPHPPFYFSSLATGDAALAVPTGNGSALTVVRWRAGQARPQVDALPGLSLRPPASMDHRPIVVRSGSDIWLGAQVADGRPQVLRFDGAAWAVIHTWPGIAASSGSLGPARVAEIALGADGAAWVQLFDGEEEGVWRRGPRASDAWYRIADDTFGPRDVAVWVKRTMPVGKSDLLVVGESGEWTARRQDLYLFRVAASRSLGE